MEPKGNSPISTDRNTNKNIVASSATSRPGRKSTASSAAVMKPNEKSVVSSATSATAMKPNGNSAVSSAVLMKSNASTALSSAQADQAMFFRDVSFGPHEAVLRFRLIHFWEAQNPNTKTLIGQEMLLIDEEGTVIQGFVPAGRVGTYELVSGSVYKLNNFFGSRNKAQYRVSDHIATVTFAWNTKLFVLDDPPVPFLEDSFRFHSYEEFQANCDRKVDLYDYVGHMKLVNRQTITEHAVLDEIDIAEKRHLCVHVQTHDGPVMKLYLWDKAASDFCEKFKSYGSTPSVLLVTTVNPKRLGGHLNYIEGVEADHCVPVPQALLDTIGQTYKFLVKVSDHNLSGKTQTITVTKIFPTEAPRPVSPLEERDVPPTSDDFLKTGSQESGPSRDFEDYAGDRVRKADESLESDEAKRSKSG
ncbi:hypothetical protein IGI04_042400 [Brassica rapa subsp. trilocularis]|uniref:DUF223 domain-containing protein n=1 Tax=Brassica rapa subsp. trilocularis TaxID=1813537 RepID=A0ABQ7KIE5_BRACM|nr:hypothetical protein IGI04_042400 [Brassica rapa subsp. trilocularis]